MRPISVVGFMWRTPQHSKLTLFGTHRLAGKFQTFWIQCPYRRLLGYGWSRKPFVAADGSPALQRFNPSIRFQVGSGTSTSSSAKLSILRKALAEFLLRDLYVSNWLSQLGHINLKLYSKLFDASPSIWSNIKCRSFPFHSALIPQIAHLQFCFLKI